MSCNGILEIKSGPEGHFPTTLAGIGLLASLWFCRQIRIVGLGQSIVQETHEAEIVIELD